ncbi:WbqC family protein [Butyrivibrio sp. AC2005]|uniref:WbqC family protein n=1 Tax=Butyrivibrio sp. AC2005 TaxID=1280672 RepID=UPI00041465C8|nr:WbqC family protein [Butyrivibrio sp. AC2005]
MGKSVGLHQTYFFPYLGYFTIMNNVDIFVYADSLQYIKQGWVNRNRIISESGQVQYINVPIKHASQKTPANEVEIDYDKPWEEAIINKLWYYKKKAPYYNEVVGILEQLFSKKYDSIAALTMESTNLVQKWLGREAPKYKLSDINLEEHDKIMRDEWGIIVTNHFPDADTYRNAPGGIKFYDRLKYGFAGMNIEFLQNRLRPYDQKNDEFIPGLSIIDVMMFNTPEEVNEMISDYYVL